jgi:hypothetical protein
MTTPNPPDVGTAPSPAPTTEDPSNFDARADAFHAFFPNWLNVKFPAVLTWIKDRTTEVYNNTVTVASNVASAAASAAAALVSANNANASAVSASADAAGALSYLNNFKGQYYGPLATDPATDPLGNPPGVGDLYWNTTAGQMRVFSGGAWVQTFLPASAYMDLVSAQTVAGVKTFSSNPVLSAGTANGVAYLNGSKVLTTGSALTFDGARLSVGAGTALNVAGYNNIVINGSTGGLLELKSNDARVLQIQTDGASAGATISTVANGNNPPLIFGVNSTEQMRLTSTGLGIGTSSPAGKLDVRGNIVLSAASAVNGGYQEISFPAGVYTKAAIRGYSVGTTDAGELRFYTAPAGDLVAERARIDSSGNFIKSVPTTPPSLAANGTMVFNLTSNTNLRVSVRGSDGVTRTANITLA